MGKIVAFVHAKGTSERVPSKNLKLLNGKPLFYYAVNNALNAKMVDEVVIDSDSDEILELGKSYGATILKRPHELATNLATGDDLAYWQASNRPESDVVLQVIPTAPFLKPESIDNAIKLLLDKNVDSVAGVAKESFYLWKNNKPAYYVNGKIPNSKDLEPLIYETTGLYVNKTCAVLKTKKRLNPESCLPYFLSKIESVDINTPEDFEFAEFLGLGGGDYSILAVIPARYESSRLPGKPLADICGKPMIYRVWENAIQVPLFDNVIVATDDLRIASICEKYNMNYMMTDKKHPNCTSRLGEVARQYKADIYVSVNGDEPLIDCMNITSIVQEAIMKYPAFTFGCRYLEEPSEVIDPSNIKVIVNENDNRCVYISRTPIPCPYKRIDFKYKKSIGIECYSKESLDFFLNKQPTEYETIEDLTFLRFIENNKPIYARRIDGNSLSVDTQKDLEKVREIYSITN